MGNIYILIQYFIIYSFFGWIMETTFRSVCERKLVNTGFLHGPVCPIYGIGTLIMLLFLSYFKENMIVLFLMSVVVLTLWEYVVGIILEKVFNTKYWDYSNHKFNFQGRICLSNSIAWGFLGVIFIVVVHPFVEEKIELINPLILEYIIYISLALIIIDTIYTVFKMKNIRATLQKIESINIEIKKKLKELKETRKSKDTVSTAKIQKVIYNLKRKQKRILIRLYRQVYRIKEAFPAIDSKDIREVLNKKLEIKKLTQKKHKELEEKKEELKK